MREIRYLLNEISTFGKMLKEKRLLCEIKAWKCFNF